MTTPRTANTKAAELGDPLGSLGAFLGLGGDDLQIDSSVHLLALEANNRHQNMTSRVKREIMDLNETIIEVADHRRHLQLIKDAVLDAQDLCARTRSTVQASQELLQQVDDLYRSNMGPVLHKKKYGV